MKKEIKRKIGIANNAFNRITNVLLVNRKLSIKTRKIWSKGMCGQRWRVGR